MTPDQDRLMIQVFQFGFSTGSRNRFDCLRSFIKSYPELETEVLTAAAEFEKGVYYYPEHAEKKAQVTPEQMKEWLMHTIA